MIQDKIIQISATHDAEGSIEIYGLSESGRLYNCSPDIDGSWILLNDGSPETKGKDEEFPK